MKKFYLFVCTLFFSFTLIVNAQDKDANYGKTPDELVPFGRYQDAYIKHFLEPQPFLGAGREKKVYDLPQTIRVGFLGPLERSADLQMGTQMLNGAILAIEEANAEGGYKGVPFELMLHNDVGLWGAAANEVVKMDDEGVWGFLGSIDGVVTHVALRVALKLEIPMINTCDPDPTLTETAIPWIIRVTTDDRQSCYAMAYHMINIKGHKKIAVLRVNNRYGRVGIGEFRDSSRRLGFPLVLEVRYTAGDTTFLPQIEKIKQSGADAVMIWTDDGATGARIVKEMNSAGLTIPVYGNDRLVSKEFVELAGPLAEGVVTTYPYNPELDDPALIAFNKNYFERFGEVPDTFSAHAYDGMNIMISAIRKAGLNRALIRDLLTDMKTFQGYHGVTGDIVFDASWNDIGSIWMVEIQNGNFIYSPAPEIIVQKP